MQLKLATDCRPPLKTTGKKLFAKTKQTKKAHINSNFKLVSTERFLPVGCIARAPKLTSDHLQSHVLFDVVEPARDLYTAAVCTCIFCLHFPDREGNISVGNIAPEIVPLRFSERHPIPSGVQNFVIALWVWAWASAPAHIGDVLMSHHLVETRQPNRLPYYSSNNSFRCSVGCQGRKRKDEHWQSPMLGST